MTEEEEEDEELRLRVALVGERAEQRRVCPLVLALVRRSQWARAVAVAMVATWAVRTG